MKRTLRYNLLDVFTDRPLAGNPLAVFTNAKGLPDETMQAIAREMNLSETVFFFPPEQGGHAKVRIFTPKKELPFAGHPILGSAWVLAGPMEMNCIQIETAAGLIPVELFRGGDRLHLARMTQPLPTFTPFNDGAALYSALGIAPSEALLAPVAASNGPSHVIVEAASKETVDALRPDFTAITRLTDAGVLVFAQDQTTCHARYFAPAIGINEDPATGSAAGPLGALLVRRGRHASGEELTVIQGEAMLRPSTLLVTVTADGDRLHDVKVAGSAVVIARGELSL